jgi:hypothetical protein
MDNGNLTMRRCPSPYCPGHMAQRMVKLAKYLGVKNIGPATALHYIRQFDLKSHVQLVPLLFKEKPELYLWEIGELAMLTGMDKRWREICVDFNSMEEFASSAQATVEVAPNKVYLMFVESFFKVRPALRGVRLNVMLSGSLDGYRSKPDFVRYINETYGKYVQLVDIGKRKSDCHALIREKHTTDHEKTKLAQSAGIPILSPNELIEKIESMPPYKNGGR